MKPSQALLEMTPIGKFVYRSLDGVLQRSEDSEGDHQTAVHFLRFLVALNEIFLQDCAAMRVLHPERCNHPMFTEMTIFNTDEYKVI